MSEALLRMLMVVALAGALQAAAMAPGRELTGTLDGRLHVDVAQMGLAIFNAVAPEKAELPAGSLHGSDRVYEGVLRLPGHRFRAAVVRSSDGSDVVWVDSDGDGRFEPEERVAFRRLEPAVPRLKSAASVTVKIAEGQYRSCPLKIALPADRSADSRGCKPACGAVYVAGVCRGICQCGASPHGRSHGV